MTFIYINNLVIIIIKLKKIIIEKKLLNMNSENIVRPLIPGNFGDLKSDLKLISKMVSNQIRKMPNATLKNFHNNFQNFY